MALTKVPQDMIVPPAAVPEGPAFAAYLNGTQSVSNGVWAKVAAATEEFDPNLCYDTAAARFTPTVEGYYLVTGKLVGAASTTASSLIAGIYKNGSLFKSGPAYISTGTNSMYAEVTALVYMNGSTDYIEFWGVNSGSGTNTLTSGQSTTYWGAFLARRS
jgi:hypothetical protein